MQKLDDIKPYSDNDNIRTFSYDVDDDELIWHRDKNSRTVEVLSGVDWKFQRDNELPFVISDLEFSIRCRYLDSEFCL